MLNFLIKLLKISVLGMVGFALWTNVPAVRNFISSPIDIAQAVSTTLEMQSMKKLVEGRRVSTGAYPNEVDFTVMILEEMQFHGREPMCVCDHWGWPYSYIENTVAFEIRSVGPDGEHGSGDDLVVRSS